MSLREELEVLRGEPIKVFTGDPMDIPCIETSDPERLCKHPVVSVLMITYNHEPYIRQAIEGVMMQKTDFEFELVIGEDCSQDKTREICFEYQKKYPDKIRVLWWHENLRKVNHPGGGNGARTRAHCRGEFIALCEGDDYWIDSLKLQKQVDVMRRCPECSFCFCNSNYLYQNTGSVRQWPGAETFVPGLMNGRTFFRTSVWGRNEKIGVRPDDFVMTATTLYRKESQRIAQNMFEIFSWRLALGDLTLWTGLSFVGDVYYLPDVVSVYRRHDKGATMSNGLRVFLDGSLVRMFFSIEFYERFGVKIPFQIFASFFHNWESAYGKGCERKKRQEICMRYHKCLCRYHFSFLRASWRDRLNMLVVWLTGKVCFMNLPLNPIALMSRVLKVCNFR